MTLRRHVRASAAAGTMTLAAVIVFALAAVAVQIARGEYAWWQAPLSFYLSGPHGPWLQLAYVLLGTATGALGIGLWATLAPAARLSLAPVLFVAGGAALVATALWPGPSPGHPVDAAGILIHTVSALAAFLCVGAAMLLQSCLLRHDPHWRRLAAPLLVLAAFAFGGLWLHALWRELPRGASQKAVIALYLLWLGAAARRLRRLPQSDPP